MQTRKELLARIAELEAKLDDYEGPNRLTLDTTNAMSWPIAGAGASCVITIADTAVPWFTASPLHVAAGLA